jgi:uncharacterized membrane protein YhaH (DUF805 family)
MEQTWWKWLFIWKGRVSQLPYLLSGTILVLLKYVIDGLVAAHFGVRWQMWSYVYHPLSSLALLGLDDRQARLYFVLWAIAIPFFWVSVALTLRRLRDAGINAAWVLLLFVPFANFALFLWMALAPSRSEGEPVTGHLKMSYRLAVPGVLLAAGIGLVFVLLSTSQFAEYGAGLFLGVPFLAGFIASWFLNLKTSHSTGQTIAVSVSPIGLIALAMIVFKFEGLVCLVMALPLALPFSIAGGLAARDILRGYQDLKGRPVAACVAVIPLLMFVEYAARLEPPVMPVRTSIVIDAPVSVVWRNVISFPPLAPPSVASPKDWVFLTGIAYPASGRIVGSGVGAVRYCHFSTGDFVEPITVWDENHLLAFDVAAEPPALHELSPWEIMPPHLEHNYLRSRHGQFRLVALDDHHTLLEGTTWYQDYFWPQAYWRGWSDMIIHRIHMRVLEHVKRQAEMGSERLPAR